MNVLTILAGPAVLAAAGAAPTQQDSSPEAERALSAAAGQALQGDIGRALAVLHSVPAAAFGARDTEVRACMTQRFAPRADGRLPIDYGPVTNRAIGAFRAYWRAALLDPGNRALEEERLGRNLARLSGLPTDAPQNQVEEAIKARLSAEGFHALLGRTPPLRELIVWRDERRERVTVALPEGDYEVPLVVLDDFPSLGWSAFATCDRSFTGGWTRPDGIYAVRPGWQSFEDEVFRISFLAHEAQHFADRARFGELASWELEYRAKLTELALARTTVPRLLTSFASNQADDQALPHSYANKRVLFDLRTRLNLRAAADLERIPVEIVNEAAWGLLMSDSDRRLGTQ